MNNSTADYLPLHDPPPPLPNPTSLRKPIALAVLSLLASIAIAASAWHIAYHPHRRQQPPELLTIQPPSIFPSHSIPSPPYTPKSKQPTILHHSPAGSSPVARNSRRTAFHFQPEKNWINDPNAPLYYKGWYHLFYQYNPHAAVWGLISWGHAVSVDLIHWLYLDPAMAPDEWYDQNGVWTGSATFLRSDLPVILYTGSTNESVQVQNLAVPEDPSDPLLRRWKKHPHNPIMLPPSGVGRHDFRDPTTAWQGGDGIWRLGIGSKVGDAGMALLYKSADFRHWRGGGQVLHRVEGTGMWECLDFYPVLSSGEAAGADTSATGYGVRHVLKASLDEAKADYYAVGVYHTGGEMFVPSDPGADVGRGLQYDYGKYYASKTFYDPVQRRRVLWGWVNESDSEQDDVRKGWASLQAIPRQIWFDNRTRSNLIQWPVDEVSELRRGKVGRKNLVLRAGDVVEIEGGEGGELDIELSFRNPIMSYNLTIEVEEEYKCGQGGASQRGQFGPFGLLVLSSSGLEEQSAVYFYIAYYKGSWRTHVCSDQSRSSLAFGIDKSVYGNSVPVMEDEDKLSLRVIVDNSIVETFAQGGRVCITARVYPTIAVDGDAHLFLFNNGTTPVALESLEAWHMDTVVMHPFF